MLTVIVTRNDTMRAYNFHDIAYAMNIAESITYGETINIFIDGRSTPIATFTYGA